MAYANRAARAVVVIATGVLVIAAAYAAGRAGTAGAGHEAAIAGSWLGEALIFAPPTVLVLSAAEPGERPAAWLAVETATNSKEGVPGAGVGSAASFITGMMTYLQQVAGPQYGVIGVSWFDTDTNNSYNWRVDQTASSWQLGWR